ncbi:MAG: polysaccharide pyruvyl transferase family protein [Ruminiclostridium sp.]|nr:polysaccharide pyruvyl transferase family protein [Ruminiclostridium sp.]
MNIYILHASNTYNYGSMMMAENFIHYFEAQSDSENSYYVETDDIENTQGRLRSATGLEVITAVPVGSLYRKGAISKKELLLSLILRMRVLSDMAMKMNMVVVLGGDDYTEDYGWRALVSQLLRINVIAGRIKVCFMGQTMGPFYSFRRPLARHFLSKADAVMVRDRITFEYLQKMRLRNIDEIPDLALMPLTREGEAPQKGRYICLFPSELIYRYSKVRSRSECLDFYVRVCQYLMSEYADHELVLLPHVLKPESSDDRVMTRDIFNALGDEVKSRTIMLDNEMLPYEVRGYIKSSEFIVSARMHPVISALECGIPAICFSYSRKYWGILDEGYKLGEYILDVRSSTFDELFQSFRKALGIMQGNYKNISGATKSRVETDQKEIIEKISELSQSFVK